MIFLSGTYSRTFARLLDRPDFGLLCQPATRVERKLGRAIWAADNGCFGKTATKFDLGRYLDWLAAQDLSRCLFATAPDVPYDAAATLERSASALPQIRELQVPAALVAQDGLTVAATPWDSFDCLFIGGTTEWKFSAASARLAAEAEQRCKWVHVGRVNSEKALNRARYLGADSVDGNFLKFAPDANVARLLRWFRQQSLGLVSA